MLMVWCFIANHSFLHAGVILPRFSPPGQEGIEPGPLPEGPPPEELTVDLPRFVSSWCLMIWSSFPVWFFQERYCFYHTEFLLTLILLMIFSQNWNGWEIHFRAFSPWLPIRKVGRDATDSAFMRLFILPMIGSTAFAISPTNQKLPFRGKKQFQQDFRLGHTHRYSSFYLVLLQFL